MSKERQLLSLILLLGLVSSCGAPPADQTGNIFPSAPSLPPSAVEPHRLTAPPLGLTAPPLGFSAVAGKLLMPPEVPERFALLQWLDPSAWAVPLDQLRFKLDGQDQPLILQDQERLTDGSLSARYYLPQAPLQAQKLEVLNGAGQTVLQAPLTLSDRHLVAQDLDVGSTALLLLQSTNSQLNELDILQSPQFTQAQQLLQNQLRQTTMKANELRQQMTQIAGSIRQYQISAYQVLLSSSSGLELMPGQMSQVFAQVKMANGTYHRQVRWASSNPQVAWVDSQGHVYAFATGQIQLTAIARVAPYPQATLTVKVNAGTSASPTPSQLPTPTAIPTVVSASASPTPANGSLRLVVTPKAVELRQKNETQALKVQWEGTHNNSVPIPTLRWTSSQPEQIQVDSQGIVTALVADGEAEITVMLIDNPSVSDSARVRVKSTGQRNQ